jgi:hypothetical protein
VAYFVPPPYAQAIRSGVGITYTVDATYKGSPVRLGMRPTGGGVTDTIKPGVRRNLSLDLAPDPGLYDLLSAYGTVLTVTAQVRYTNQSSVSIPMGVFDIDSSSIAEGGGKLSLTAPDFWVRVQRAKFGQPAASTPGSTVISQIVSLLQGALGASATIVVTASNTTAVVPSLTWDSDRAQAIIDLATSIGAWVYFDRTGTCTVADLPRSSPSADWLIDASASGVMLSSTRSQDRTHTYNVVVVDSSSSASAAFPAQVVWDNDPASPTYAGPDPLNHPELAGPFGVVVYKYTTSTALDAAGAAATARSILTKTTGLTAQATLGAVPNPAIDAYDALDVISPKERYDIARPSRRMVVDTVTHPLDIQQPQQIQGRSTRTDPYS